MVRPGILAVSPDGSNGSTLGEEYRGGHVSPAHMSAECVAGGEHAKRLAIIRIDRGRFLKQGLRDHVVLSRQAPVVR